MNCCDICNKLHSYYNLYIHVGIIDSMMKKLNKYNSKHSQRIFAIQIKIEY